jgi:hypothetical protein
MITEKEYLEAQMIIKLYESQQLNISGVIGSSDKFIPPPPSPPPSRRLREGAEPPKPKNYRQRQ